MDLQGAPTCNWLPTGPATIQPTNSLFLQPPLSQFSNENAVEDGVKSLTKVMLHLLSSCLRNQPQKSIRLVKYGLCKALLTVPDYVDVLCMSESELQRSVCCDPPVVLLTSSQPPGACFLRWSPVIVLIKCVQSYFSKQKSEDNDIVKADYGEINRRY